jgi:transposase InsO family protein
MWQQLQRPEFHDYLGFYPSQTQIEFIYSQECLWCWNLEPRPEIRERPPYEACQVNLIWHTDLHLYSLTHVWMIAFIDDCSRRIMGWEFLSDKSSASTATVLRRVLAEVGEKPLCVWSDNGTEFQGEFRDVLERELISPAYTEPYTPQQNGKIERFWPTVEKCRDPSQMAATIEGYNNWCNTALPRNPAVVHAYSSLTPNEAYASFQHWVPPEAIDGERFGYWRVGGKMKTFRPRPVRPRISRASQTDDGN